MERKVIDLEVAEDYENSGVSAIALVDVPAIEKDWMAFRIEKFVDPSSGETEDEFLPRCIAYNINEGKDTDQAAAICYSVWENHAMQFDIDNPCWEGYEPYGLKDDGTPNCVPVKSNKEAFAESYTDYPESAVNNAKRALAWVEKNGWGDCGMGPGKARANQLANKEPISEDTIARMSAFQRHRQNSDTPYGEGCGGLMYDAWGGESGVTWAERKLKSIRKEKMSIDTDALPPYVDETVEKKLAAEDEKYDTIEEAQERSEELGLNGEIHSHATEDGFIFMPGASHADLEKALAKGEEFAAPASGNKGDRPLARIPKDERGRTGSDKNKPGDSTTTRGGVEVSDEVEKTLKNKIEEHNKKNPQDSQKATLGMLKAVWRRGAGAYSIGTPGKRGMARPQWAMARVNAFLNILAGNQSGYDKDYKQDNDLLPKGHPKHSEAKMAKIFFASEDQQIVVGPAMIPGMEILRKDEEGLPYYVRFSKEVIQRIAEKFMMELRNHDTNIQHDSEDPAHSFVMETWLVENEEDKANSLYGFEVPIGTWMVKMRVQDPETWKQIKEGKLNGFSIEGNFMERGDYLAYQKDRELYDRIIKILKSV